MPKLQLVMVIVGVVILAVALLLFAARIMFNRQVTMEVTELLGNLPEDKRLVTEKDLENLPPIVRKWLVYSQVLGKERISAVRLHQQGVMQLEAGQGWIPLEAEQYFTVDRPGFIWKARAQMNPLLSFTVRDKYFLGRGNMQVKLASLIPMVDGKGPEMDQGTLLRYLGESVWFPTAALSEYIKWESMDADSARATMSYGGVTAAADFHFNEQGQVTEITCKRYRSVKDGYSLEECSFPVSDYREFRGFRIPARGEGIWKLKTGNLKYIQLQITGIRYNHPREGDMQ